MKLLMCNCSMCKRGRKNSWYRKVIQSKRRGARTFNKIQLRKGFWENLKERIYIGYTD